MIASLALVAVIVLGLHGLYVAADWTADAVTRWIDARIERAATIARRLKRAEGA